MTNSLAISRLVNLEDIFKGRFFKVPDYQRGYAWEREQILDLIRDIEQVDKVDYMHFTGTIVASYNEVINRYDIVDGQQRLTTIIILISELIKKINEADRKKYIDIFIKRGSAGNEKIVLELNEETKSFYTSWIIAGDEKSHLPKLTSHYNIIIAKKIIKGWIIRQLKKQLTPGDIINTIISKMGFILYSPKHDSEIGIMFEVINNRGKDLSELEKVKNYLIYFATKMDAPTLRDMVNDNWGNLLQYLNDSNKTTLEDEKDFLRYCSIVYLGLNKTSSHNVYEEIKKRFSVKTGKIGPEEEINNLRGFIQFLIQAGRYYAALYSKNPNYRKEKELAKPLEYLRSQTSHASIMPLYLSIMIKEKDTEIIENNLRLLELLNFRVYMAREITARSDTGQGDLFGWAHEYYEDYDWKNEWNYVDDKGKPINNINSWLQDELVGFIKYYCQDNIFKKSFILDQEDNFDFYKWSGLRYFLMCYEEWRQSTKTINIDNILLGKDEKKINDYYSIEHLWARENRIEQNDRPQDEWLKRRIGNLALLEMKINIQAGKLDLKDKIKIYQGENNDNFVSEISQILYVSRLFPQILKRVKGKMKSLNYYYNIYKELIDKNENQYISFALKRWGLTI